MKYLHVFLFSVLLTGVIACSKKDDPNNNNNNPNNPAPVDTTAFDYKLGTVPDVDLSNGGTAVQSFDVTYLEGKAEKVTIAVSGLPAGVTDSIAPAVGTPTYTAFIAYTASAATPGTYTVKVTTTGESGLVKEDTFTLSVANRKDLLLGKWKRTQNAVDSNDNGQMDENEIVDFDLDAHYTFNADGSGTLVSSNLGGAPLPITWALQNGDRELKIVQAVYTITSINKTELIIYNIMNGKKSWMIMTKEN